MPPPFTLAALEVSIGKRLGIPAYELRSIASEIYDRYERGGPTNAPWRPQRVTIVETSAVAYDLCRGEWFAGVYSSPDEAEIRLLADALNELEQINTPRTGSR